MSTKLDESHLRQSMLRRYLYCRIFRMVDLQKNIPYHIEMINNGEQAIRDDYDIIQTWYTQNLESSIDMIRNHMELIDLDELDGFSVPPIQRPLRSKANGKGGSPGLLNELCQEDLEKADEEIMAILGLEKKDELESYMEQNFPTHSPPSTVMPADSDLYDDNGFYIAQEEIPNNNEEDHDEPMDIDPPEQDGHELCREPSARSGPTFSFANALFCSPESTDDGMEIDTPSPDAVADRTKPLSFPLRVLLSSLGADPGMEPSSQPVTLTVDEFKEAERSWTGAIRFIEETIHRQEESCEETIYLETWDPIQMQCNWQKELLFLCHLTEAKFRDMFKQARDILWMEVKIHQPQRTNRRQWKPLRSPLRNQLCV
ncbi:hypothetical protein F4777DRAFT_584235 [Nemania sp. FL0916]|nr:hypothetical protein F4777DRAFT_584235 [Nemania sp. FL0916]